MKKKGFTLIELLAVIVILAIIALIAVPTILNIINNAKKSAFKDSVYGIIKSGELYYTNKMMEIDGMTEVKTFTFPEADGLEIKGSKPTSGTMIITKEGKIGIAVSNGKYCIKKGYTNEELIVDENLNNCSIPSEIESIMTSENACVNDTTKTCPNGTEVTVQVNDDTNYNFYVIKDTGNELTLIMDRNLGDRLVWTTLENTAAGPLSLLDALETRTSTWTNIPTMNYTLSDDGGGTMYQPITKNNVRARLLTYTEASNLGCTSSDATGGCPSYLCANLSSSNTVEQPWGYWLSSASSIINVWSWTVRASYITFQYDTRLGNNDGIRPVIVLSKTI